MSKTFASPLLLLLFLQLSSFVSISAAENEFRCNCDEEGFWSIENILECQKVSDFLIAIAYFSIPIELLYFVSCSNIPFKWVLVQFIAFIVLCGMTHLLNGWTYGPHTFQLMLALTIFKCLTALVSFATAITLFTLIPMLLKVKVREIMLKKKTWDLDREVGIIKKQKEAGLHVRMLTQEIRKYLDRHTILYTTLVQLSKTLDLKNCAVWMPNEGRTEMDLIHELHEHNFPNTYNSVIPTSDSLKNCAVWMPNESRTEMNLIHELHEHNFPTTYNSVIPTSDPDVREIKGSEWVKIIDSESPLALASTGGIGEPGSVAAIRMPMLRVSNFKGGTPEMIQACYAILVLVLPDGQGRSWTKQELEIVEVVADQVTVAVSHAAVLEESQLMRDKLVEQNRALELAKEDALMASQARNAFQMVMSNVLRGPMHSILGLLSVLQDENLSDEQCLLVDTTAKTGNVLSTLINDVMGTSAKDNRRLPLVMMPFQLHSMIKEAACLSKCLCAYRGCDFAIEVDKHLANYVVGDEKRVFQVILHMVGNLLNAARTDGGFLLLRVCSSSGSQVLNEQRWRSNSSDGYAYVRVEVSISSSDSTCPGIPYRGQRFSGGGEDSMSFNICKKLVQLMQGDIWMIPNPKGFNQSVALVLQFQLRPSIAKGLSEHEEYSSEHVQSNSLFRGLKLLLVDADDVNRAVKRKLLEKLGCFVSVVSSGYECLGALGPAGSSFQVVLLDPHLPDLDGFEVAMKIRKFRSRSRLLIVALTASDDGETREKCFEVGMNGVISKPGSFQEIASELKVILMQAG